MRSIICFRVDWGCICTIHMLYYIYTYISRFLPLRATVVGVFVDGSSPRSKFSAAVHMSHLSIRAMRRIHTTYLISSTILQRKVAETYRIANTHRKLGCYYIQNHTPDFPRAFLLRSYDRITPWFRVIPTTALGFLIINKP